MTTYINTTCAERSRFNIFFLLKKMQGYECKVMNLTGGDLA